MQSTKNDPTKPDKNSENKKVIEGLMNDVISQYEKTHKPENESSKKEPSPREQLRFNANFKPIETLTKEFAFYQFLCINNSLKKLEGPLYESLDWKDPNFVEKIEKKIKYYNACAENWNDWVETKSIFGIHPETMGQYVEFLRVDDYIWQLLCRQLLIYNTFYNEIDDKTIEEVINGKKGVNTSSEASK